jgi:hypothetical protein
MLSAGPKVIWVRVGPVLFLRASLRGIFFFHFRLFYRHSPDAAMRSSSSTQVEDKLENMSTV